MTPAELQLWVKEHQVYDPDWLCWKLTMLEVLQAHADEEALRRLGWRPQGHFDVLIWDRGF